MCVFLLFLSFHSSSSSHRVLWALMKGLNKVFLWCRIWKSAFEMKKNSFFHIWIVIYLSVAHSCLCLNACAWWTETELQRDAKNRVHGSTEIIGPKHLTSESTSRGRRKSLTLDRLLSSLSLCSTKRHWKIYFCLDTQIGSIVMIWSWSTKKIDFKYRDGA